MAILWDEGKNKKLRKERGISFEEVADLIIRKRYVGIVKHKKRPHQCVFLIPIHGYVHAVLFVLDDESNINLKTIFPSRKFHRQFGGEQQ